MECHHGDFQTGRLSHIAFSDTVFRIMCGASVEFYSGDKSSEDEDNRREPVCEAERKANKPLRRWHANFVLND